ncbi:SIR2 family protein [Escherichia coli]|uniref:SIR2 family protein n=1 Tax=Proteus penneri TaxID=102862 RepID=UPI0018C63C21|nr:SIR2 family protein [Proteus penneri]MBG6028271.1 SIR2 family protein [Proteus mirabilis]MBG6049077.1 SIR2 family protein [Proteus mirabilis]MCF1958173.1 SIR2 family protein [Escherichia coli]
MPEPIFNFKNYPIIFIGSGISKRYLSGFPSWPELLEEYWDKVDDTGANFYSYLTTMRDEQKETSENQDTNHQLYTEVATIIEDKYNKLFNEGKITLEGLSPKIVFNEKISPFKYSVCKRFSNYSLIDDVNKEELNSFQNFLKNAKIIVTTNYDSFIEDLLKKNNIDPKIYIGNEGFFDDSVGWGELYKIHGDINSPSSITINKNDYDQYDEKSILISAKILSNMIRRPIIFIGYSLTDRNVRKLLSDFSSQLPKEDGRKSAARIIVIERKENEKNVIKTQITDQQLQITYTLIQTDNYQKIFDEISHINEGLSPYHVLQYQKMIKDIIITEGRKGNLSKVLVTPSDLNQLQESIKQGKNIVVALGDERYIYTHIKENHYMSDYILDENNISHRLAIDYVLSEGPAKMIPFSKLIKNCDFSKLELSKKEIERINSRIKSKGKLSQLIEQLKLDKINSCTEFNSIDEIKTMKFNRLKTLKILVKNIKNINIEDITRYVKEIALPIFMNKITDEYTKTELRRLFLAYDLLINGDVEEIEL